ncbi:glycosyltransferase family 2 protein [uncultured Aliiroseovarius sp.]|uniref:glycosyltransferase family 2 protein n=1 Tax=uncultured Aliiroseovarius sp. TaxID=1658783 RepID=UPI002597A750|nr:glycosyltransferase family 2 protein [uncultured Aliiroseovarius sp.]
MNIFPCPVQCLRGRVAAIALFALPSLRGPWQAAASDVTDHGIKGNMAQVKTNTGQSKAGAVVSDIFGTVDFPLKPNKSPHGRVTAVSMMKDEGPFVLEWIAHHLAIGFTDLVVFTNDCSDGTDDILIRLEELGLAHHRRNVIAEGIRPQPSALKHAQVDPLVGASDWLLVFDADEFLCIRHGDGSLDGMITAATDAGANGIVITWRIYGSGGIHDWSRAPVTEQYLHAAPPMWNKGWGVKTLFKFDPEYWKLGIHRPKIKNKHLETDFPDSVVWLNGSGRLMEDYFKFRGWRSIVRTVGYDWAQMNHYAVKSIDSYAIRKFRGNVNLKKDKYNADYWALQDRNEVFDDLALRHADRRRQIFDTLLTDPVLHKLHAEALARAEARLAEFKGTDAYVDLVRGLKEASKTPITQVDAKPPVPRDPARIAALMSEVEKKRNAKPKSERRHSAHPDWGAAGDIYVSGSINLDTDASIEMFENRKLKVPADPRVFTPTALQQIMDGKFERNAARRILKLLPDGATYLEIGTGIGFLPAVIASERADVTVIAQEQICALAQTAADIWKLNGLPQGPCLTLHNTSLIAPDNAATSLTALVQNARCDVLMLNDPQLDAKMLLPVLKAAPKRPNAIVLGARALSGHLDASAATKALRTLGYDEVTENPLAAALLFTHGKAAPEQGPGDDR